MAVATAKWDFGQDTAGELARMIDEGHSWIIVQTMACKAGRTSEASRECLEVHELAT